VQAVIRIRRDAERDLDQTCSARASGSLIVGVAHNALHNATHHGRGDDLLPTFQVRHVDDATVLAGDPVEITRRSRCGKFRDLRCERARQPGE